MNEIIQANDNPKQSANLKQILLLAQETVQRYNPSGTSLTSVLKTMRQNEPLS